MPSIISGGPVCFLPGSAARSSCGYRLQKGVFDQINQLSAQGVDGFRQYNISEAMEVIRESQKQASGLLEEYRKMEYPIHIYTDALRNQSMGYLLYLQWNVGVINVTYTLFAAGSANLMIPEDS